MKKRYIVFILLVLMGIFGFEIFPPVLPVIQMPGEVLVKWHDIGLDSLEGLFGEGLTNTFLATIVTYVILIGLALSLRAGSRTSDEVPTGFYNFFEMIVETAFGFVQNSAGKYAKDFFPFFMTFVLLIITANWLELVPGVDSIGKAEDFHHFSEHKIEVAEKEAGRELTESEKHAIEEELRESSGGKIVTGPLGISMVTAAEKGEKGETIVPYLRVAATDLNFTFAMAIISVIFTQYYGFKALGVGYLKKFFQFDAAKIAKNPLGALDPVVGILELVSEISKIISFAFRLFGNIFAGQVLLFVIGVLLPLANVAIYGLEFFVGAIQAMVFGLLTLTFMSGATVSHDHDEH